MTKTTKMSNAERRRFIASQRRLHADAPERLLERWQCFIDITREPVPFSVWLAR